jgi:hypothetical protein
MRRIFARVWPSLLVLPLLALPVGAEVYHVTLNNGTVVDTAYQPQEASWDPSMVLLLTDVGNWIGVPKADIQEVHTESQEKGFGIRIDDNTYELGLTAGDLSPEALLAAGLVEPPAGTTPNPSQDAAMQLLRNIQAQQQAESQRRAAQDRYSIQQFVEPSQTQGIPGSLIGNSYGGPPPQ